MASKLYILGASGAGVSTLGRALGDRLSSPSFDVDDYYWLPTDPPFQTKRSVEQRLALLRVDLATPSWVLSGSLDGWGDAIADLATHVIYLDTDTATRVGRLREREFSRYGARVRAGGDMADQHEAFVAWAASYDEGSQPGRSRRRHETWLKQQQVPVIRLDGAQSLDALVSEALDATSR